MDTFRERFDALGDIEELLSVAAPQYRSPEAYYEDLIANEKDKNLAEKRLRVLEDLLARTDEEKAEKALERLRRERNQILKDTDWTQLPDVPLDATQRKFYRKYREYLRVLPEKVKVLGDRLLTYEEWLRWIETVRHTPGYENYIP